MERPYIGNAPAETPVQGPDIAAGTIPFTAFDKTTVPTALGYLAGRRRTINGAMEIDQANAGASVTVNNAVATYGVDQFVGFGVASAGVFTMQQSAASPPAGFKNYSHLVVGTADASPAAGSAYAFYHMIEGNNVVDFQLGLASAIPITLSFWVRSSLTGQFSGVFKNSATNRSYPFTYTINNANTWEYKSVPVQGDTTGTWLTDTGVGLYIVFDLGCGSNNRSTANSWQAGNFSGVTGAVRLISTLSSTFDITGVQVEPGANVTPYERRLISDELARCQRYYEKSYDQATAVGAVAFNGTRLARSVVNTESNKNFSVTFAAVKRVVPTMTYYSPNSGASAKIFNTSTGEVSVTGNLDVGTSGFTGPVTAGEGSIGDIYKLHFTAIARL